MLNRAPLRCCRSIAGGARGVSLVELLVGIAVGMVVVAGAIKLAVDNVTSNRRLVTETRLNQDLRATADVVARDLRRAGYWDSAVSGLWAAAAANAGDLNPYASIDTSAANTVVYSYQRPNIQPTGPKPTLLGFKWSASDGIVRLQNGAGGWQPLNDPGTAFVTAFSITPRNTTIELWTTCACRTRRPLPPACQDATLSTAPTRPQLVIRNFDFLLSGRANTGQSAIDTMVTRQIRETVRVRNDELVNPGGCPR